MMLHFSAMLHESPNYEADSSDIEAALNTHMKMRSVEKSTAQGGDVVIPLTTISKYSNFDSMIQVFLIDKQTNFPATFDSGNACLIFPYMEKITALPNWQGQYFILATGVNEPWGCPANIVTGPILLPIQGGEFLTTMVTFYACTGDNASNQRTSNFGAGCVTPWSANGWNTPHSGIVLKAPLAYTPYECVTINFAAQADILSGSEAVKISTQSSLTLTNSPSSNFTFLQIIPNYMWMSVYVVYLSIDSNHTAIWPGYSPSWPQAVTAYAFIDTGGGPANLSDPNGYLYNKTWPDPSQIPAWANSSLNCIATSAPIGIELQDSTGKQFGYYIDTRNQPVSAQGLTLVMCEKNNYMMNQYGMNVGGVTALSVTICINYSNATVGFHSLSQSS